MLLASRLTHHHHGVLQIERSYSATHKVQLDLNSKFSIYSCNLERTNLFKSMYVHLPKVTESVTNRLTLHTYTAPSILFTHPTLVSHDAIKH
jgi:hypothetical protein